MPWAAIAVGAAQLGLGAVQKGVANREAKKALAMRKAYSTPAEIYKILQATENRAQQGFDPVTLDYLTNETDRAFTSALGTAEMLGADPNMLSGLFDQKMQGIMKIGAENHQLNMQNFSQYLGALSTVAGSKDAEWLDQENKVKDLQQKAAIDKADATKQISEGLDSAITGVALLAEENLYKDKEEERFSKEYGTEAGGAYDYAKSKNLSFKEYKKKRSKVGKTLGNSF